MHIQMALKACAGIFSGINNKFATATTTLDVFARRAVTRLASGHMSKFDVILIQAAMGAGWEEARNVCVAINARAISDIMSAFDMRR
jgi:hypothetical protein